jgi:hypothetical protein
MSDDWQEAAFSNRHTHNRNGRGGKGGKANAHGFNVQKTFGSYEIKSLKFPARPEGESRNARLEVYTLNEEGNAIVGELFVPGCLSANVLMAGSRRVMKKVVRELEREEDSEVERDESPKDEAAGPDDEDDESDERDRKERQKVQEFEKNSFRSPKFWLKWQGRLLGEEGGDEVETDDGYIVFSGNGCEKFDGTLSCEKLGWKNVKVTGWKIKGMSARDFEVEWVPERKVAS